MNKYRYFKYEYMELSGIFKFTDDDSITQYSAIKSSINITNVWKNSWGVARVVDSEFTNELSEEEAFLELI